MKGSWKKQGKKDRRRQQYNDDMDELSTGKSKHRHTSKQDLKKLYKESEI